MTNGATNGTIGYIPIMNYMLKLDQYFSTPIGKLHEPYLANSLKPIAREIVNDTSNQTNIWGYNCTYGTPIELNENLEYFNNWALSKGKEFFDMLGYDTNLIDFKLEVFISEMFDNDYHPIHTHPNSKVSGILYLDTPPGSSMIRFHDPRPFRDFVSFPKKSNTDREHIELDAAQGWCYLWPAWLQHEVLHNQSGNAGRLAIVFNM